MFAMDSDSSRGPDGITSAFFKIHWNTVGKQTIDGIHNFFVPGIFHLSYASKKISSLKFK